MEVPIVKRIRLRRSREDIAAIVSSFHSSGQSQLAFAQSQGIAVSSLRLWVSRAASVRSPKTPRLLPITLPADVMPPLFVEVALVGGRVLRFGHSMPADDIAAICDALERPCLR